jgi:UDP-glucose:(heptosyl)LPS alpha-1,3-glucosyltransferase
MRLCLVIATLFPTGGLQRDCLAVAARLADAGHAPVIVTARLRAAVETAVPVEEWRVGGLTNPGRDAALGRAVAAARGRFDRVVGFNKMHGLDVYYAGDPPYAAYQRGWWRAFSPRARAQRGLEGACMAAAATTRAIMLSQAQAAAYRAQWNTPPARIRVLPPTLDATRARPWLRHDGTRERLRAELGLAPDALVVLSIGAVPRVKGLDRAAAAVARVPGAVWLCAGLAPGGPLGGAGRLLGPRADIPELLAVADVLLHPARLETTGTVLLEAMANGVPVICSDACGYAPHVAAAGAGLVLPSTDDPGPWAAALGADAAQRAAWGAAGIAYAATGALSGGLEEAARLMVEWA